MSGRARLWLFVLLAAAAVLPFIRTMAHDFVWDDVTIVTKNPATDPDTPFLESLASPYWPPPRGGGLYRPWPILVYRASRALFGLSPAPLHASNVLLHALAAFALLFVLSRVWPERRALRWTAAFLFAVHPIHTEAVAGIVGSSELWAALWGFLAFGLWIDASRAPTWKGIVGAWAFWLLALASKESAVGWLLVGAAVRFGILPPVGPATARRRVLDIGALGLFAGFVLWRSVVLGSLLGMSAPPTVDNPLVVLPLGERILAASGLWMEGARRLLVPSGFMPDAGLAQTIPEWKPTDIAAAALLAVCAAVILWRGRRGEPWTWGLAAGLAIHVPTMNILFPIGTCYAERLFYAPSFGYFTALGWAGVALVRATKLPRRVTVVLAAVPVLALGLVSYRQAGVWKNNRTLFEEAVAAAPKSVKAHTNLAVELWHAGELDASREQVRAALRQSPDYVPAMILSARLMNARGEQDAALQTIQAALRIDPRYVDGWLFRGGLHLERAEWEEAREAYRTATQVDPSRGEALIGIASALAGMGLWEEAVTAWERAKIANPGRTDLLYPYGSALLNAGRKEEAREVWNESIRLGDRQPKLLNDLAWLILEDGGDLGAAESLSREAVGREPSAVHTDTLLRILMARGKLGEADSLVSRAERSEAPSEMLETWRRLLRDARAGSGGG